MPKWRNATLFLPPINMHQSWMARCVSCWFSCASHTVNHAVLLQSQWLMEEIEWWGACACRPVGFSSSAHKLSETVCCSDSHASVLQHLFIYSWRNSTLWRISFCLVTHVSKHRAFTSPRLNYIVNSNSSQRNVPFPKTTLKSLCSGIIIWTGILLAQCFISDVQTPRISAQKNWK